MAGGDDAGDNDSGMESMTGTSAGSKDLTPEKPHDFWDSDDGKEEEELDETIAERLWGLTEMFPVSIRNATYSLVTASVGGIKNLYSLGRSASWIFFSSAAILFAPVIFEVERAQTEEMQRQQQRQILLGPNAAVSGSAAPGMGVAMGMMHPPPPQR